jgi:mono/diheme cytochrome c family protein
MTNRVTVVLRVLLAVFLCSAAFTGSAAGRQGADTRLIEKGKAAYEYWCATCHARGMPGTTALAVKYKNGSRSAVLEERLDLTPQLLLFVVRNGASVMPFFRKTEVSDADLAAITAYLTRRRAP